MVDYQYASEYISNPLHGGFSGLCRWFAFTLGVAKLVLGTLVIAGLRGSVRSDSMSMV